MTKTNLQLTACLLTIIINVLAGKPSGKEQNTLQKAARIHHKALTIDSHNDTPMWFADSSYNFASDHTGLKPTMRVDLPQMEKGGLDAAFFAVFTGQGTRNEDGNKAAYDEAIATFNAIHKTVGENSNLAEIAQNSHEASRIVKSGKKAVFIGLENGYPIGGDLNNINTFYQLGARYITLCHTRNNDICDSSTDSLEHNGISGFGKQVIERMNTLGIMVDVSHVSDKSFYDAIALSKTPVIASHSCARALCDNPRNMSDDMLRALSQNGGVIQMCILSSYVKTPPPMPERDSAMKALRIKYNNFKGLSDTDRASARREWHALEDLYPQPLASVKDVVDHIDHIVKVAGIKHVGIGTDFDGGGAVIGCENAGEMGNITLELVKRGYSARQIKLIWSKNLLRVMKETERYAKHHHSATKNI